MRAAEARPVTLCVCGSYHTVRKAILISLAFQMFCHSNISIAWQRTLIAFQAIFGSLSLSRLDSERLSAWPRSTAAAVAAAEIGNADRIEEITADLSLFLDDLSLSLASSTTFNPIRERILFAHQYRFHTEFFLYRSFVRASKLNCYFCQN